MSVKSILSNAARTMSGQKRAELAICIFRFIRPLIPVVSAHRFHSYSPGHSSVIRQSLSHTI